MGIEDEFNRRVENESSGLEEKDLALKKLDGIKAIIRKIAAQFGFEIVESSSDDKTLEFDTLTRGTVSFQLEGDGVIVSIPESYDYRSYQDTKELLSIKEALEEFLPDFRKEFKMAGESLDVAEFEAKYKKWQAENEEEPPSPGVPPDKQDLSYDPHSGQWFGYPK